MRLLRQQPAPAPDSHRERGFSMIEILIALTVTVTGLMGLMSVQISSIRGNQISSRLSEAAVIGQQSIEELRSTPIAELEATFGPLPIADAALDTAEGRSGLVYDRTLFVEELTAASSDLIRVRVEVSFTEAGAVAGSDGGKYDHRLALELVRTRQEAL